MNKSIRILLIILFFSSCNEEDETCGLNSRAGESCLNASVGDYNIQNLFSTNPAHTRENLQIVFREENSVGEKYSFYARANMFNGVNHRNAGEAYIIETGKEYFDNNLVYNANYNAPGTGDLRITFSKVDRENGAISGTFTWNQPATDLTQAVSFAGNFTDISVSFQ